MGAQLGFGGGGYLETGFTTMLLSVTPDDIKNAKKQIMRKLIGSGLSGSQASLLIDKLYEAQAEIAKENKAKNAGAQSIIDNFGTAKEGKYVWKDGEWVLENEEN